MDFSRTVIKYEVNHVNNLVDLVTDKTGTTETRLMKSEQ